MLKVLIISILALGIIFYFYMGFHQKIEIKDAVLPPKIILYKEYLGDYHKMEDTFKLLQDEITQLETKNIKYFAIFYDAPDLIEDVNQSRAVLGVLLDIRERHLAGKFLVDHADYRISENSELNCLSSTFPYRNMLSMLWVVTQVYPAWVEAGVARKLDIKGNVVGSMEIFHYVNGESTIEVLFPYGPGVERLFLNRAPEPVYKKTNTDL